MSLDYTQRATYIRTGAQSSFNWRHFQSAASNFFRGLAYKVKTQYIPRLKAWFTSIHPRAFMQRIGNGLYRAGQAVVSAARYVYNGVKGFVLKVVDGVKQSAQQIHTGFDQAVQAGAKVMSKAKKNFTKFTDSVNKRGLRKTLKYARRHRKNKAKGNAFVNAAGKFVNGVGTVLRTIDNAYISAADKIVTKAENHAAKSGKARTSKWKRMEIGKHAGRVKALATGMEAGTLGLASFGISTIKSFVDSRSSREDEE